MFNFLKKSDYKIGDVIIFKSPISIVVEKISDTMSKYKEEKMFTVVQKWYDGDDFCYYLVGAEHSLTIFMFQESIRKLDKI